MPVSAGITCSGVSYRWDIPLLLLLYRNLRVAFGNGPGELEERLLALEFGSKRRTSIPKPFGVSFSRDVPRALFVFHYRHDCIPFSNSPQGLPIGQEGGFLPPTHPSGCPKGRREARPIARHARLEFECCGPLWFHLVIIADEDGQRSAFDRHRIPHWYTGLPLLNPAKVLTGGGPRPGKNFPVAL